MDTTALLGAYNQPPPSSTPGANRAESLIVRVDQPVQGIEFQPHTLLRGIDGTIITQSRRLEYQWLRSKSVRTCEEPSCTRQRVAASFQDLRTGKRYCSKRCMQTAFRQLGETFNRTKPRMPSTRLGASGEIDYDETDHQVWDLRQFQEDPNWVEVGKERNYVPLPKDVGHVLKLIVSVLSEDGSKTTISTTSEETPVVIAPPPPPPKRRLIPAPHVMMNPQFSDASALQFRVVTYNILADIYATQQMFPYCPRWALSWRYRRAQILRELEQLDADVICLQEVQQDHFQQFLLPALARMGYEGVYKSKTREALGSVGKIDGCATLYRRDKFTLIETHEIEFNKAAYQMAQQGAFAAGSNAAAAAGGGANNNNNNASSSTTTTSTTTASSSSSSSSSSTSSSVTGNLNNNANGSETSDSLLRRANTGGSVAGNASASLLHRANSAAGAGGLLSDAGFDSSTQRCLKRLCKDNVAHVLVLEGQNMNGEIEHVCVANVHIYWDPDYPDVKLWQTHVLLQELEGITGQRQLPLVLCGDFNSTPDSSVVELLAQEQVDPKHPDLAFDKVGILPPANQLTHTLGLVSAVAMVTGSEPVVTNFTAQYKGVLDYMWLNESLAAVACLEMLGEDALRGADGTPLPNSVYPSDHISICCDVRLASHNPQGGGGGGGLAGLVGGGGY